MLQPTTVLGGLVGGLGGSLTPNSVVERSTSSTANGATSPIKKVLPGGEELLPLSSAPSVSSGVSAKILVPGQVVSPQAVEDEERLSLLEDGGDRRPDSTDDEGLHHQRGLSTSMRHLSKDRASEKLDRRRNARHSSHADGWNVRENFWWLWGGSQHSGLLCMLASALCYSIMGLLIRLFAVHSIPPFETVAVRCTVIAALSAAGLAKMGHPLLGTPSLRLLLGARAAVGFLALCAFFYSISVLPLRDATVLNFTAPVFTSILGNFFLDEKFTSREMAASACCLVGVLMVNQPPLLFGGIQVLPDLAVTAQQRQENIVGVLTGLFAAMLGGAAYCLVRVIGKAGEPPLVVVFVFSCFTCVASLLCLLLFQSFVVPSFAELAGMLLVGVVAFAAQVLLTRSLQLERAGRATAMQYMKVVGTYALGVLFWGEIASFKGLAGVILIGVSIAFIAASDKESGRIDERA